MLKHYSIMYSELLAKRRGRKHSIQLCTAPELWVSLTEWTKNIHVHHESGGNCVCTLKPDNSMVVTFGHWHTQATQKIIAELTLHGARLYNNHIWYNGYPTEGGELKFTSDREYIAPQKYVELQQQVYARLEAVTISPKTKLMLEIGQWKPRVTVTQKVKDVALGKISCQNLTARDEFTCVSGKVTIVQQILEEAV